MLPYITYQNNETPDNNSIYFLMQVESVDSDINFSNSGISEINLKINGTTVKEIELNQKLTTLPFYCFEEKEQTNIENLNFNKFKLCESTDYLSSKPFYSIVAFDKFVNTNHTTIINSNIVKNLHANEKNIEFEFIISSLYKYIKGKIKKIFHKQFDPNLFLSTVAKVN